MHDLSDQQLQENLDAYRAEVSPDARYASFDYCYNYFQAFREGSEGKVIALAEPEHLHLSALQLGFYLASWGMYRGSTTLIERSVRHLVPVIDLIAHTPRDLWTLDVTGYGEAEISALLKLRADIGTKLGGATDTLATKIMLGVFGNVPAFDTQFKAGFRTSGMGRKSLREVRDFAHKHKSFLDDQQIYTHHFLGGFTTRRYPNAKLLDMIFFVEGSPGAATGGQNSRNLLSTDEAQGASAIP